VQPDPAITVAHDPAVYASSEDTTLLLRAVEVRPGERFLEVGTGTGLVALHAANVARATATDVNPAAVRLARQNALANRLPLAVVRCDLLRGLRGPFDIIAFNPPYLIERIGGEWTDRAWQGGPAGDEIILRFLAEVRDHLAPTGRAYLLVPSNRERALAVARERFRVRVVAERPLFFETLRVLELTNPG